MRSNGRVWGIILSCVWASAAACDTDDSPGGGASGAGAAGEQAQAGMPGVDAGGLPNETGGSTTNGGADPGGQAGHAGGGASGHAGGGAEAGQSLGGSNGGDAPPTPLSCPDGASGAYNQWLPLGGASGAGAGDAFHRLTLGSKQTAIAINDSGQMLIASGWGDSTSCQAWVVDADSVSEVTTTTSGCVVAVDMNEAGTVLASQDSVPFLWKDGVATPLAGIGAGIPVALNDAEQVVLLGTSQGPVLWEAGSVTVLRTPADVALEPVAINESGRVIGFSSGEGAGTWLWEDGVATEIGLKEVHALNDVGDIAGVQTNETGAGVWSNGTFSPLSIMTTTLGGGTLSPPDWNDIRIHAMTDDGVLVGDVYEIGETDLAQPFHLEAGVFRRFDSFGSARDVNRHGEIVGRRASIRFGPIRCECWTIEGSWSSLWVRDCPSACCAP